jgi:hypothetical protein
MMGKTRDIILAAGPLVLLLATGCSGGNAQAIETNSDPSSAAAESGGPCAADNDCIPSECCHPNACVSKSAAPKDCRDKMCTMECVEGSMDCGAGVCACLNGACAVRWSQASKAE